MRRTINIVDRLDRLNSGIWNAATATATVLKRQHGIESEIWYPAATDETREHELAEVIKRPIPTINPSARLHMIQSARLDPAQDLIISHGCWQFPTRWGSAYKKEGFRWIAVPHGMLEPWQLSQKSIIKLLYYKLVEKPALLRANRVRAVGRPEFSNLEKVFGDRMIWIPNGIPGLFRPDDKEGNVFLFMSSLHPKKGLLPLLEGWRASKLGTDKGCELRIAGPDGGEREMLDSFLSDKKAPANISFLGEVYGTRKWQQLNEASFFVLPSHSEGFPTSVLEAMAAGLIPLISNGCNFPDALERNIGIHIEPQMNSIREGLERAVSLPSEERDQRREAAFALLKDTFTYERIAEMQAETGRNLLAEI